MLTIVSCSAILELKFSVIIPTYNRSATLGRAIQSVISQTLPAWEIIVVDDGSSDDTRKLVEKFSHVRYHYQANAGVCAARNKGAEIATGDWLIFLDSDDELELDSLKSFEIELQSNPSIQVLQASYTLEDSGNLTTRKVTTGNSAFVSGSFVIKKEVFQILGGYDCRLKFAENTELQFRLSENAIPINKSDFLSFKYHSSSNGGSKNLQNMLDSIRYILTKHDKNLNEHVKHLYHQNIGVIEMRFGRFEPARKHLWKAWKYKPKKISTLLRIALAYFPLLARKIYTPEIGLR